MSLLERVIIAHKCRSMHHYIAMEALNHIGGEEADAWKAILLTHNASLFEGAKAPDAVFKDFQNHVLHVQDGEWGGARDAAMEWYARSVEALRARNWRDAAYNLGVLSHYYADVCQPFHTGQTEEEGAIHRAVEWSIVKSADQIFAHLDEAGYPAIDTNEGPGFVADMVLDAARASNLYYDTFIDHYDLDSGVQDPPSGIDETMFGAVVECVGHAVSGFAALISRAVEEAAVAAPKTTLSVRGYLASLKVPIRWISKKLSNAGDRKTVEKMYAEFQKTGKVIKTLPEDDKLIRKLHARFVRRIPLAELDAEELRPLGTKHVPWEAPSYELDEEDSIEEEIELLEEETEETVLEDEAVEELSETEEVEIEAEAFVDEAEFEPIEDIAVEAAPVKLSRAEKRAAKKAAKEARRAERAAAKLAAREDAEALIEDTGDAFIAEEFEEEIFEAAPEETSLEDEAEDTEQSFETQAFEEEDDNSYELAEAAETYEDAELELDEAAEEYYASGLESDEHDLESYEPAYEDTEEFQAELAELAAIDLGDDFAEVDEASSFAEQDFAVEEAASAHLRRDRLNLDSPVVDAPSIGRKTAKRLGKANIRTVIELLDADPTAVSEELDVDYITPQAILDWQDQCMLMMEVPGLRTHDVQVLVGAGIRTGEDLARASTQDVFRSAMDFLSTHEGGRISHFDDEELVESEVEEWIDLARQEAA